MLDPDRQIPYNYTSADDRQIIRYLFGNQFSDTVESLKNLVNTGRSSRLLYRFLGDLFIIERNPFLFQEILDHPLLKKYLFKQFEKDLSIIRQKAEHSKVYDLVDDCRKKLTRLLNRFENYREHKSKIIMALGPVIGKNNIYFDAFNLCAHSTDATDWRLHVPIAVLRPELESQVSSAVKIIRQLGYCIIPRGAGTGLTGGATPLTDNCMILNTEKLNSISSIKFEKDKHGKTLASIRVGAGAITQEVIDYADQEGYIFATDPTSAWASTIGGNIAENAGGKKAVLFGTAIDNLLSWSVVLPDGSVYHVKRMDHPQRKVAPEDVLIFEVCDENQHTIRKICLEANQMRKKGLGKDVTNKALNGLPGVQKEGCDGIITSAQFIVYPKFAYKKTICIEFFGNDMSQAGLVIAHLTDAFSDRKPALMALEHFDEAYIKAINYKTKTAIGNRIIAVLLLDLVSNDERQLQAGLEKIETLLDPFDKTGFKTAQDDTEADRFWQDRRRLGAIAAHTNAFKLNEDIVIPITSLAGFASWVDQTNMQEKQINQVRIIEDIVSYLDIAKPLTDEKWLEKRVGQAKDLAYATKKKLSIASRDAIEAYVHPRNFLEAVVNSLHGYTHVIENVKRVYETSKSRLIVIATHMHAGDGNVHVNIPVLSNDRQMMSRAEYIADQVMEKAVELGGVVSGEHGVGITKFKHLGLDKIEAFDNYRDQVDPDRVMNPKKLSDHKVLENVYTPCVNLLDIEASILKHTSLSGLAMKVSNCVRCGKCKISCPVFYPDENLFYHPRNKNLGIGALIEALLYISQRTQSTAFKILKNIEQIADHCTLCKKCFLKCPVKIDTSDISIFQRNLLKDYGFKHTSLATQVSLEFLKTKHRTGSKLFRNALLRPAANIQRLLSRTVPPKAKHAKANQAAFVDLLRTPVSRPYSKTLSDFMPKTEKNQSVILHPPNDTGKTVFYFPGCGSERLYSTISMASVFLLLDQNIRVVLPPANCCCGYPFKVNAQFKNFDKLQLENIIIFSQIRSMFRDLEFNACIVSCGTCMASIVELGIDRFFDCQVTDISQYVLENANDIVFEKPYYYHAPCHDSLKEKGSDILKAHNPGNQICQIPHCCSEAGTMAMSRPHISSAMLERKQKNLNAAAEGASKIEMLTNCPSCIQGLGRLHHKNMSVRHIAQELAELKGGKHWIKKFKKLVRDSEVVTF